MSTDLSRLATIARLFTWLALLLLLAVQVADIAVEQLPWIIGLAKILPLLLFVPGMARDKLRSYIWLCFVSLMYFMNLVVRLFADPTGPRGVVGMTSVVVLFIAAMLYVRWRAQSLRQAQQATTPDEEHNHE